jgi:hypothetical protein
MLSEQASLRVAQMPTLTKLRGRLRNDGGVDIITIYSMVSITLIALILIPGIVWLKGFDIARVGTMKLAQQSALAAASQLKIVELASGEQVLRIDEDAAFNKAIEFYEAQKPFIRDPFNYPVLNAVGKKAHEFGPLQPFPAIALPGTSGCKLRAADGGCVGYQVRVNDFYDGSIMSRWLWSDVPVSGTGYAELSSNAERCDPQNTTCTR